MVLKPLQTVDLWRDNMNRRDFLNRAVSATGAGIFGGMILRTQDANAASSQGKIITVSGELSPRKIGTMLPHEHVMSTFGADLSRYPEYDTKALFESVVPYLKKVRELGCDVLADCTAIYFGRDPLILRRLSELSGLHILTNTGYYGAADDRYIPDHAYSESASELAARWIREWRDGIDGTGIRPGFIKIGVDGSGLSDIDAKLIDAAAETHLATGLVIAAHTSGNSEGALEQIQRMKQIGAHPSAWIWVHAQNGDEDAILQAAEAGAWIEFDGVSQDSIEEHLGFVRMMKSNGYMGQTLLSHDGNSFRASGREPKPYDALFTDFIPVLKKDGFSQREIQQLTVSNPAAAFGVRIRKMA
ncbi:MAG: phosphotriesterase [Candidatus Marinimicrobia bacterium]|nr:phosphotriesterase [Candidatus Neomarinimicrobiota bacterium]